jgi:integrase/recombinase XerD
MTRKKLRLKFAELPKRDQAAWIKAITPGVDFDDDGAACHLSEGTRELLMKTYGLWLYFIREAGELDPDLSPASRATPRSVNAYVAEITRRCNVHTASIYMRGLGQALRFLDPDGDREPVLVQARRLSRLSDAAPCDRDVLVAASQLFEAGVRRMDNCAANVRREPKLIAMRYGGGLMMALEACKPLRFRNLLEMAVGRNLVREAGLYCLKFTAAETKAWQAIDAILPERLSPYIDAWLSVHRPILLDGQVSDRLWITMWATPISKETLYQRFCKATLAELGTRLNPHAARHLVATSIAIAIPEEVEMIPFLLDHRNERIGRKYYNRAKSLSASARYLKQFVVRRRAAIIRTRERRRKRR